ncbi:MAG: hypothetical protein EHM39_07475, partial [Chloroflexi bacterium]
MCPRGRLWKPSPRGNAAARPGRAPAGGRQRGVLLPRFAEHAHDRGDQGRPALEHEPRGEYHVNSVERHRLALAMKEPERVPVAPSFLTRASQLEGVRQYHYHTDPEVLASAQIAHCDRYDFDGVYISSDNVILYEALGGGIIYPDDNSYPFWTTPVITDVRDVAHRRVPD